MTIPRSRRRLRSVVLFPRSIPPTFLQHRIARAEIDVGKTFAFVRIKTDVRLVIMPHVKNQCESTFAALDGSELCFLCWRFVGSFDDSLEKLKLCLLRVVSIRLAGLFSRGVLREIDC